MLSATPGPTHDSCKPLSSPRPFTGEAVRAEADAALEAESVKHLLVPQVYDDYVTRWHCDKEMKRGSSSPRQP